MAQQPTKPEKDDIPITLDIDAARRFATHAEAREFIRAHEHEFPGAVIVPLDRESWSIEVRAYIQ
jgi:hypothetical protein